MTGWWKMNESFIIMEMILERTKALKREGEQMKKVIVSGLLVFVCFASYGCQEFVFDRIIEGFKNPGGAKQIWKILDFSDDEEDRGEENAPVFEGTPEEVDAAKVQYKISKSGFKVFVEFRDEDENEEPDLVIDYMSGGGHEYLRTYLVVTYRAVCRTYSKAVWSGDKAILIVKSKTFTAPLYDCTQIGEGGDGVNFWLQTDAQEYIDDEDSQEEFRNAWYIMHMSLDEL